MNNGHLLLYGTYISRSCKYPVVEVNEFKRLFLYSALTRRLLDRTIKAVKNCNSLPHYQHAITALNLQ